MNFIIELVQMLVAVLFVAALSYAISYGWYAGRKSAIESKD